MDDFEEAVAAIHRKKLRKELKKCAIILGILAWIAVIVLARIWL